MVLPGNRRPSSATHSLIASGDCRSVSIIVIDGANNVFGVGPIDTDDDGVAAKFCCNTWTARMLRAGGVNLLPSGVITADELMARLRAAVGSNQLSGDQGVDGKALATDQKQFSSR